MTTNSGQFGLFKRECRKWIDRFGLNGWRFDFHLDDIEDNQAQVNRDFIGCVATVVFNTKILKLTDKTFNETIKDTAKHEMIHVLLGNHTALANSRFVQSDEIVKSEEELARKLEGNIK